MILAFDPSSQAIGYAALKGLGRSDLVDGGLLKPSMAKDALGDMPAWLHAHLRDKSLAACWRVLSMLQDAADLVEEHQPEVIVVEIPSGKTGTGSRKGAKGSLTTYGFAAGDVYGELRCRWPMITAPVNERMWTPDRGGKWLHQVAMDDFYPQYDRQQDPGADTSDAIGLARWWITHHAVSTTEPH
jgi:hypothetical protein